MSWFFLSLVSALAFGISGVALKYMMVKGVPPVTSVALATTVSLPLLWLYAFRFERLGASIPFSVAVLSGLLFFVGTLSLYLAIDRVANPGFAIGVMSLNIVLAALLSLAVFNLPFDIRGFTGLFLVFLGIILLSTVR